MGPRSEFQVYFFAFFHCFSLFFAFFAFFLLFLLFFALNFSLRFDLVIFASERSKIQVYFSIFSLFFAFFAYFSLFSLNFCFASIFSLNFRSFYLRFRFRFLVFCIEVNHVKSGIFLLPSETKFSLQFQISLPKRK